MGQLVASLFDAEVGLVERDEGEPRPLREFLKQAFRICLHDDGIGHGILAVMERRLLLDRALRRFQKCRFSRLDQLAASHEGLDPVERVGSGAADDRYLVIDVVQVRQNGF
jgi:hypothetical protein